MANVLTVIMVGGMVVFETAAFVDSTPMAQSTWEPVQIKMHGDDIAIQSLGSALPVFASGMTS